MQKKSSSEKYTPAEDTFFLADHIEEESGDSALDIGTGSGFLAQLLLRRFETVVATDISFDSLRSAPKECNLVCCSAADPLRIQFDLIVCNMPYLPSDKILDKTTDGGREGLQVPLSIIKSAKKCLKKTGKIIFLSSTLANYEKLMEQTAELGLETTIQSRKKLFYEELILLKACHK